MLLAMAFVTVALLYVTGPSRITTWPPCPPGTNYYGGNQCPVKHRTTAWERLYYQVVHPQHDVND
jgi:hypothetical protein